MPKNPLDPTDPIWRIVNDYLDDPTAKLAKSYLDSPAARLAESYLNSPSAKLAQSYIDSPTAKLAQAYLDSPAARLAESYLNSPSAKLTQSYIDSSAAKLAQAYLDSPAARVAESYLNSPAASLAQSYPGNFVLPIPAQHSLGLGAFVGSDQNLSAHLSAASRLLHFPRELERFRASDSILAQAMSLNHTRWLDITAVPRSISAFTELHTVGNALRADEPFGPDVAAALRLGLGDWRGALVPDNILDSDIRHEFYIERGLDLALTAFPSASYPEVLASAGLSHLPAADADNPATGNAAATELGTEAFRMLRPFEIEFREFLASAMSSLFGPQWIKHRVSGETRKRWMDRRADAVRDGEVEKPLHAYADLFDYAEIIIRNDNWTDLFERIFLDKNEVQVSFRRLNAVRRPLVHGRDISNEDLLFVNVEIIRLRRSVNRYH